MREIKFRVWDKKFEKIIYPEFLVENDYGVLVPAYLKDINFHKIYIEEHEETTSQENIIIMQYIGLKDKNNKEIFEGDIVKRTVIGYCETIEEIGFIDFQNGSFVFNSTAKDKFKTSLYEDLKPYPSKAMPEYEVVGNVYENPELLKNLK